MCENIDINMLRKPDADVLLFRKDQKYPQHVAICHRLETLKVEMREYIMGFCTPHTSQANPYLF